MATFIDDEEQKARLCNRLFDMIKDQASMSRNELMEFIIYGHLCGRTEEMAEIVKDKHSFKIKKYAPKYENTLLDGIIEMTMYAFIGNKAKCKKTLKILEDFQEKYLENHLNKTAPQYQRGETIWMMGLYLLARAISNYRSPKAIKDAENARELLGRLGPTTYFASLAWIADIIISA